MAGTNDFMDHLQALAAFVQVAECGSFSQAARQLVMTPSAVSRQVAKLEQALGVRLMHRSTRQLRLTDAGLDVLEHGRQVVVAARAASQVAERHLDAPRGLVRLSAPKAYARQVLQAPLLDFLARYPEVDVQVVVTDRRVDALRENVDIVLRLTDEPPPGMVCRALRPVRQWLVASPAYLGARPAVAEPEDLLAHSCLALGEQPGDLRWRLSREGDAADVRELPVRGRFTANHTGMRREAAEAGFGIACLPDFTARAAVQAGRLVRVLPQWTLASDYQGAASLLFPAERQMPPKVRVLIDHLVEALRA